MKRRWTLVYSSGRTGQINHRSTFMSNTLISSTSDAMKRCYDSDYITTGYIKSDLNNL